MSEENRGMVIVVAAENDSILRDRTCPACLKPFPAGSQVFESWDQTVAIHVTCVVSLALVATLRTPDEAEIEATYQAYRQELLDELQPTE